MPRRSGKHHDAILFGAIFRRLRKMRGWNITIAAQRCGMNANYLGSLEKGGNVPSVSTLLTIAEVYGSSAADIVREVEDARSAARKRHAELVAAAETPARSE